MCSAARHVLGMQSLPSMLHFSSAFRWLRGSAFIGLLLSAALGAAIRLANAYRDFVIAVHAGKAAVTGETGWPTSHDPLRTGSSHPSPPCSAYLPPTSPDDRLRS